MGGAGKAMAYELLEQPWVQADILKPRPTPETLRVTIIDTAQEEIDRDYTRIQELEDQFRHRKEELRDTSRGRPGDIDINYIPVTERIQLHDQKDLIGDDAIPRIAAGRGIEEDNWWLKPEFIDENLDFTTGVVRRRGLGKALYYKAYAEDDDVRTAIDLPNKGEVAVFAGLGGGTGSGLLIDVVNDLKRTQRSANITLFGVLPNDKEGQAENANAHAALSEIEYLSLTHENLFKDCILIPIDPTDFGGKTQNILKSSDALLELDRAAVYLILSYYNMMDLEDPFDDMPSYAPFTIGIPQVLRYNVDAIQDAKTTIQEILTAKRNALEAESDIYAEVDRFLIKQRSDEVAGELHDSDRTDLKNRLKTVESLVEFDLFEELEYESVAAYRGIISEAKQETDEIDTQIDIIGGSIRAGAASIDDQYVDSIDKKVADVVKEELTNLDRRKQLLEKIRGIETNRIEGTLGYLIGAEEGVTAGVRLKKLETKLEDVTERRDRLERELDEAATELERKRDDQQEEIDRLVDDWSREVEPIYREYEQCQSIDIEAQAEALESAITAFTQEVENAETVDQLDAVTGNQVRESLNTLSADLEPIGVSVESDKREINSAVADLLSAKEAFLQMNKEESVIERFSPFTTSAEEERKDAKRNYQMQRTKLDDSGIFTVSRAGTNLSVESQFDPHRFVSLLERETDDRERQISDSIREYVDENSYAADDLARELETVSNFDSLVRAVEDLLREEIVDTDEIESRKAELEAEFETAKSELTLYEGTVELFEDLNSRRDAFLEFQEEYTNYRNEYNETGDVAVSSGEDDHLYIKKVKPNDVLQLREDSDLKRSKLFEDRDERQRLEGSLEDLARKAQNSKYNGIRKRRISNNRSRYTDMNIVVGVMSQAIDQIAEEADLQSVFQGPFNLGPGASNYASYPVDAGDSWDIGLGMFIGGIFLDNLRAETEPDGYFTGYQARDQSDDTDILVHHTHKLEEGYYVRRNQILNLENPTDVNFFLREESEIVDDLLAERIDKHWFTESGGDSEAIDQTESPESQR